MQIGICGTFDVANYGDLLFPLIAEAELSSRLGPIRLHRFSYSARNPPDWPYPVTSLSELPARVEDLDGLIIGGGDVIRFDKSVAPGYEPPTPLIHHPTGYWLSPALLALDRQRPVVWNAPGVHGDVPAWAESLMHVAIRLSRYVAVRDEPSRAALSRFSGETEIAVVPDTGFGIERLIGRADSARCERLRASLDLEGKYIVIQASPYLTPACRFLKNHATLLREYRCLALPIGPVLGDESRIVTDVLPQAVCLPEWPDPLLLSELIRGAAGVVAMSLHLSIAALAFGVPVFRPRQAPSSKYSTLWSFEGVTPLGDDGEIDPHGFTGRSGPARDDITPVKARLQAHWDAMARALAEGASGPAPRARRAAFWQGLAGILAVDEPRRPSLPDALIGELAGIHRRLVRIDASMSGLGATMAAERQDHAATITERDERIEALTRTLAGERRAHQAAVDDLDAHVAALQAAVAESRAEAASRRAEIVALRNSACYRMTAPLRWIHRVCSRRGPERDPS